MQKIAVRFQLAGYHDTNLQSLEVTDFQALSCHPPATKVINIELLPIESAFFSSFCSGFGHLLNFGDSPTE